MHKLALLSLFLGCGITAPAPQAGPGVFPTPECNYYYTIDSQEKVRGDLVIGDYTVKGGSSLNAGSTYSVGVTITAGIDISVADIAGLGLSASVSVTDTKATSQGASVPCPPGNWHCALAIYPEFLEVKGFKKPPADSQCWPSKPEDVAYTVRYPVQGDSGGVDSEVDICSCHNYPAWADNGAPSIVCDPCHL